MSFSHNPMARYKCNYLSLSRNCCRFSYSPPPVKLSCFKGRRGKNYEYLSHNKVFVTSDIIFYAYRFTHNSYQESLSLKIMRVNITLDGFVNEPVWQGVPSSMNEANGSRYSRGRPLQDGYPLLLYRERSLFRHR